MTTTKRKTLYGPWRYENQNQPWPYDDTLSYPKVAEWLDGHGLVEDWGCGTAWAKQFFKASEYRGVDGAWSRWCDVQADLREYTSDVPCAMMRHVLEHNLQWREIASNFSESWNVRAAIVFFIPVQPEEFDAGGPEWPVPDLAVAGPELIDILGRHGTRFEYELIEYPPEDSIQWGMEQVLLMER